MSNFNDLFFREGENGEISEILKLKMFNKLAKFIVMYKQFKKRWVKEKVSPEYNYFIDNRTLIE